MFWYVYTGPDCYHLCIKMRVETIIKDLENIQWQYYFIINKPIEIPLYIDFLKVWFSLLNLHFFLFTAM